MRTLLLFFIKHRFFALFLLLEIVSALMLVNSYSYQRMLTFNAVNDLTGSILKTSANFKDYFSLRSQNDSLAAENARLRNRIETSFLNSDSTASASGRLFRYYSAHVVSNSVNHRNNYIMLDKGSLLGMTKEMGVVSSQGIAGIVIGVSPHFSLAMSLLHQNAFISARIKKNGQLVNVKWKTDDYRFGTVTDIPSYIMLAKGDTIVTSGNSLIFPKDIPIGTVVKYIANQHRNFNVAKIKFCTDFNSLHIVYLIKNLMINEQTNLLENRIP